MLVSVTLTLLVLERASRGRARYARGRRARGCSPVRLRGPRGRGRRGRRRWRWWRWWCGAPVVQLTVWSVQSISDGLLAPEFGTAARNSLLLATMSIALVVGAALLLAYGRRVSRLAHRPGARCGWRRSATGCPARWWRWPCWCRWAGIDHRLDDAAGVGLMLTGTVIALFVAYTVRFVALAFQSVDAGLERVPRSLDEAARGPGQRPPGRAGPRARAADLGRHAHRRPAGIHRGHASELPATLLLRPLGGDTLAVAVWQATTESLYETAALPALLIVLVGLLPVAVLIRLSRRLAAMSVASRRGEGLRRHPRRGRRGPGARRGRAGVGARALGLRQDDAAAPDRRVRGARRGHVVVAGRDGGGPRRWVPPERRRIGMVFQDYALFPHLRVRANVAFGLARRDARRA